MKILGVLTFLILICVSPFTGALAQTRVPGVSVGNTFKYTFSLDLDVSDTDFVLPTLFEALVEEAKAIDWVQITITDVSSSTVTSQMVMQFKNGTQQSNTGVTDVATGQGNLTMFLVSANLNPNDSVYLGNNDEKINETTTRTYPSGSRQLNHESISMEYDVSQEELTDFNITGPLQQTNSQDTYWDKQSGALVEMSYKMVTRSQQINADMSVHVELVESNLYTIPEFPAIMVLIALSISTIAVIKLRNRFPKTIASI